MANPLFPTTLYKHQGLAADQILTLDEWNQVGEEIEALEKTLNQTLGNPANDPGYGIPPWAITVPWLAWGTSTMKGRLLDVGDNGDLQIRTNWKAGAAGTGVDDGARAGWALRFGGIFDDFTLFRLPSGGSSTQMFQINSVGNITTPGSITATGAIASSSNITAGGIFTASGASVQVTPRTGLRAESTQYGQVEFNGPATLSYDVNQPSWLLRGHYQSTDQFQVWRRGAGAGGTWVDLFYISNTGLATVAGGLTASSGNISAPSGTVTAGTGIATSGGDIVNFGGDVVGQNIAGTSMTVTPRWAVTVDPNFVDIGFNTTATPSYVEAWSGWLIRGHNQGDVFQIWRRAPGTPAGWSTPLWITGSTGRLSCTLQDNSVSRAMTQQGVPCGAYQAAPFFTFTSTAFGAGAYNNWLTVCTIATITVRGGYVFLMANHGLSYNNIGSGA